MKFFARGGSSPLSRGIPSPGHSSRGSTGIIPALAGNTGNGSTTNSACTDHPRSRGEYRSGVRGGATTPGSSPLSRGIRNCWVLSSVSARIIPALAGNTGQEVLRVRRRSDHPRSRGEYKVEREVREVREGSSPLSRGIQQGTLFGQCPGRIIPALAGNTGLRSPAPRSPRDHPRSRGEYGLHAHVDRVSLGSSPLSRGILGANDRHLTATGIIPALAGNTGLRSPAPRSPRDHPRSRGEYSWVLPLRACTTGSSPLSRGILRPSPADIARGGIIPALAGNT